MRATADFSAPDGEFSYIDSMGHARTIRWADVPRALEKERAALRVAFGKEGKDEQA